MNHIELFAGCGGLSLGLKAEELNLILANELSPMAAETFAYNFFKEDLAQDITQKETRVLWLSSAYPRSIKRLRENPQQYPKEFVNTDISKETSLQGKLVVGDIRQLNILLENNPELLNNLRTAYGAQGGLDLVSGGPPCQSFSLAGMRKLDDDRNTLPWDFAHFVELTQPKFVLLENVGGILKAFEKDNEKFYAWFEVAKTFAKIGYVPLSLYINAKYAGVAQNRPRFLLLAIRNDIYSQLQEHFSDTEKRLFKKPEALFHAMQNASEMNISQYEYIDIEKEPSLYAQSFLHPLYIKQDQEFFTVADAIGDLMSSEKKPTDFVSNLNNVFKDVLPPHELTNHVLKENSEIVQRRFRIYQVMNELSPSTRKAISQLLKGSSKTLTDIQCLEIMKYPFLTEDGLKTFTNPDELLKFILEHPTKKQAQKALVEDEPAPTALSIPDDACHYDINHTRTLSVREMARVQSFPDNFSFRSKVTTGGKSRRFEVPQYTQIGNAVPPLLGVAIAKVLKNLKNKLD